MRRLSKEDIENLVGTKTQSYTIIKARVKGGEFSDSDNYGIVLAHSEEHGYFTTWQFHLENEAPNYYWGHYHMGNQAAAEEDYRTRD